MLLLSLDIWFRVNVYGLLPLLSYCLVPLFLRLPSSSFFTATVYPAFCNHLGAGARDHALDEHTTLKQLLITLDGMKLQQSDGTINQEYVQKMRETLHVSRIWILWKLCEQYTALGIA